MNLDQYFQVKRDLQNLVGGVRLRYAEWEFLMKLDGRLTLREVGRVNGLTEEELTSMVNRFIELQFIETGELSYDEFLHLRRNEVVRPLEVVKPKMGSSSLATSAGTPNAPSTQHRIPAFAPLPVPKQQQATIERAPFPWPTFERLEKPAAQPSSPAPVIPAPAAPAEDAPTAPAAFTSEPIQRKMSLKALMDFIMKHAGGDSSAGHLMVYRVFMRIETRLLKRNGIHSLRFQEDRVVADAELEKALLDSVTNALGVTCPEEVFVA